MSQYVVILLSVLANSLNFSLDSETANNIAVGLVSLASVIASYVSKRD